MYPFHRHLHVTVAGPLTVSHVQGVNVRDCRRNSLSDTQKYSAFRGLCRPGGLPRTRWGSAPDLNHTHRHLTINVCQWGQYS